MTRQITSWTLAASLSVLMHNSAFAASAASEIAVEPVKDAPNMSQRQIDSIYDEFMVAVVQQYREIQRAITNAIRNDDELREQVKMERQRPIFEAAVRDARAKERQEQDMMREIVAEQRGAARAKEQRISEISRRISAQPQLLGSLPGSGLQAPQSTPPLSNNEVVATESNQEIWVPSAREPIPTTDPIVATRAPEPTPEPVVPEPAPAPVLGKAKLAWQVPNQRENGAALPIVEISSYEIYVTAENAGTSRTIRVDNRQQTEYTISSLTPDTYFFSMVTVDTDGMYSSLSDVVSKTIR